MSSACSSVLMQARSAPCMGCSGSMASGTPTPLAYSSVAAMPSNTWARARPMSLWAGLPVSAPGSAPTTSTRHGGADGLGLVDGLAVVLERGAQAGGIGSGKEAAAAVAGDADAGLPDLACRRIETGCLHLIAPRTDGADAAPRAGLDDGRQGELLAHRRRIHRQEREIALELAHQAIPCTASTALMRARARSGSRSRPARSARRNSSARCGSERALCWPPTMTKWSCRPLR